MASPVTYSRFRQAGIGAYFRPHEVERLGISFPELQALVERGTVEKVGHGLYRLTEPEISQHETLAMVAAAVPETIVCLLSALQFHEIGTQMPHEVWLAIDRKARKPARLPARVRFVRFSGAALSYGVESHPILGIEVRVTSPARTVVDCFRYRNKIGIDVATEALRDTVHSRKASPDEIMRAATALRARTVIRPYLEALVI
jgi:predicted transcriptional regulator of viral defense system